LTLEIPGRIVCEVNLNCRHIISALLIAALLAGGLPYSSCLAGQCASNTECASMHCNCCGPNCPWSKSSHESHKRNTGCNQQCPLITASKPVTIIKVQPVASIIFGNSELQPFLTAYAAPHAPSIREPVHSHPPTLLSLACALTI
jgi:hypothetical protein